MNKHIQHAALNVRTYGSGFDLVLLHGWGMNSGAFNHWLPYLESECRVTMIDLPGFGMNHDICIDSYGLHDMATLIERFVPQGAILIGWSLGGLIAQQIAIQHKSLLSGLVTIASSPCFPQQCGWAGVRPELLRTFQEQLALSYNKTLDRFLAIQAMGCKDQRTQVKQLKKAISAYPNPKQSALKKGLEILEFADIRQSIGKITVPTLRIYGKRDTLVPIRAVDDIHHLHPQSDCVILSDAAHAPFISEPDKTTQLLLQFTADLAPLKKYRKLK
jgi:pimeloyl-[acyl-carrier protein] methyl ester esterase